MKHVVLLSILVFILGACVSPPIGDPSAQSETSQDTQVQNPAEEGTEDSTETSREEIEQEEQEQEGPDREEQETDDERDEDPQEEVPEEQEDYSDVAASDCVSTTSDQGCLVVSCPDQSNSTLCAEGGGGSYTPQSVCDHEILGNCVYVTCNQDSTKLFCKEIVPVEEPDQLCTYSCTEEDCCWNLDQDTVLSFNGFRDEYVPGEIYHALLTIENNKQTEVDATLHLDFITKGEHQLNLPLTLESLEPGKNKVPLAIPVSEDEKYLGQGEIKALVVTEEGASNPTSVQYTVTDRSKATITVDATTDKGKSLHLIGLLGFVDKGNYDLLDPLHVKDWRMGGWDPGPLQLAANPTTTKLFDSEPDDFWEWCDEGNCAGQEWEYYESNFRSNIDSSIVSQVDFWDIWNEPSWLHEGKADDFAELTVRSKKVLDEFDSSAKIAAPSTGGITGMKDYFDALASRNFLLDAVVWHEFRMPEEMYLHAQQANHYIDQYLDDLKDNNYPGTLTRPEVHINEYHGTPNILVPGWALGWLYYLDLAEVDAANRACWWDRTSWPSGEAFSGCRTANHLLTYQGRENQQPKHLYWVYYYYAQMKDEKRLPVQTSSARTVALASKNDAAKTIRVLAGRYSCGQNGDWCGGFMDGTPIEGSRGAVFETPLATQDVTIEIEYPYSKSQVTVDHYHVRSDNLDEALPSVTPTTTTKQVVNGKITISVEEFVDGDVNYFVVR